MTASLDVMTYVLEAFLPQLDTLRLSFLGLATKLVFSNEQLDEQLDRLVELNLEQHEWIKLFLALADTSMNHSSKKLTISLENLVLDKCDTTILQLGFLQPSCTRDRADLVKDDLRNAAQEYKTTTYDRVSYFREIANSIAVTKLAYAYCRGLIIKAQYENNGWNYESTDEDNSWENCDADDDGSFLYDS